MRSIARPVLRQMQHKEIDNIELKLNLFEGVLNNIISCLPTKAMEIVCM